MVKTALLFALELVLCVCARAIPPRIPPIEQAPLHPKTSTYTNYKPQPPSRVRDDVLRVTSNNSFISRCLRMISRNGESKNFETITGQDGITFGIKDFATDDGILSFMRALQAHD